MPGISRKPIRRATVIYWLMLSYIVAALVWWLISLEKQSHALSEFKIRQLNTIVDSTVSPQLYASEYNDIVNVTRRTTVKHVSEGLFFLALIIVGAVFVF